MGSPREVFDTPRTEFVARFMGGHNVMSIDGRRMSIRADRVRLTPAEAGPQRPVTVRDVEYQGSSVIVSVEGEAGAELIAIIPDKTFYQRPFEVGDVAGIDWDQSDLLELAA